MMFEADSIISVVFYFNNHACHITTGLDVENEAHLVFFWGIAPFLLTSMVYNNVIFMIFFHRICSDFYVGSLVLPLVT